MSETSREAATREALHTIAAHVLAHRRFDVSGRFGLRAGPAGIATPSFGDDPETIRISGVVLVREVGGTSTRTPIQGSTLRDLAGFVDVDLGEAFNCGPDCPPLGPVDMPFDISATWAADIVAWYALAWRVLDDVLASLPGPAEVATTQLWPEHFDAATTVTLPAAEPVNLGFSPGDSFEDEPYLYVGPWSPQRPGDPSFWNAPFGAVRRRSEAESSSDPADWCRRFLAEGLPLVSSS